MCDTEAVSLLCKNVIAQETRKYGLSDDSVQYSILNIHEAYKPDPSSLSLPNQNPVADYNDPAHRCGYLHKYGPFHTALTAEMFFNAALQNKTVFQHILDQTGTLNLFSLGGGPGSDVLGVLSVLHSLLGFFQVRVTIVDLFEQWRETFAALLQELAHNPEGCYGTMARWASPQYLQWSYIQSNLLTESSPQWKNALGSADLVTMVKFVSAAASINTSEMLMDIFDCLRPGALVLYIDNSGGGFDKVVQKAAYNCGMTPAFGPLKHQQYSNERFNTVRFGKTPCLQTRVSVHLWMKQQHCTRNANFGQRMFQHPKRNFNGRRKRHRRRQNFSNNDDRCVDDDRLVDDGRLVDEDEDEEVSCCVIS